MTEEGVRGEIDINSRNLLRSGGWQTERAQSSSVPVLILGKVEGKERGRLNASLKVIREFDSGTGDYTETERYINLGNIEVPNLKRSGIGSAMLMELDRQAELFGAERIYGKVNDSDEKETPGLLEFYKKNGFTIGKRGEGWEIVKIFSDKALH